MRLRLGPMRKIIIALASVTLLSSGLLSPAAGADRPDACPPKLGPLAFSSGEVTAPGERYGKASCFYRSDDWDRQATIRAAWIPADQPDAATNLELTYCLSEDEEQVADRQYGEGTRLGRVFPTGGEHFVLGSYLATPKGPSTAKIVKATRALAASYAPDTAACPPPLETPDDEAAPEPTAETYGDDEIYSRIFGLADDLTAVQAPSFDREAVAACLGTDPGDMSVALIEGSDHARTVSEACTILPLILEDLPPAQATEVTLIIIALLVADEQRRQAEAAATE